MRSNSFKHREKRSSRRNKFQIWAEILEACNRVPRTQSWLLRELRLKTSSIKESLLFLIERELICQVNEEKNDTIGYLITNKGKEALINYYLLITKYFNPYKNKKNKS